MHCLTVRCFFGMPRGKNVLRKKENPGKYAFGAGRLPEDILGIKSSRARSFCGEVRESAFVPETAPAMMKRDVCYAPTEAERRPIPPVGRIASALLV